MPAVTVPAPDVDIQMVLRTGVYGQHDTPFSQYFQHRDEDHLAHALAARPRRRRPPRERGVTDEQMAVMLDHNPKAWLTA